MFNLISPAEWKYHRGRWNKNASTLHDKSLQSHVKTADTIIKPLDKCIFQYFFFFCLLHIFRLFNINVHYIVQLHNVILQWREILWNFSHSPTPLACNFTATAIVIYIFPLHSISTIELSEAGKKWLFVWKKKLDTKSRKLAVKWWIILRAFMWSSE